MLIKTLEVANFGVLSAPIQLTLHPGLNVVHGPNESGKSTLMRALWMGLTTRAKITGQGLNTIQPRDGAVPEVTVTFTHHGHEYRIHKRFAGPKGLSQLTVHDPNGHIINLNGEDAELRLRGILGLVNSTSGNTGKQSLGLWPLFWIRQGHSALSPASDLESDGAQSLVGQLRSIHQEMLAGSHTDAIRTAVANEYHIFFTATGQPSRKTGAPLHEALQVLATAKTEHTRLREQQASVEKSMVRIDELNAELQSIEAEFPKLEQALNASQKDLDTLKPTEEKLRETQAQLETEQLRDKHVKELLATRQQLQARLKELHKRLTSHTEDVQQANSSQLPAFAKMQLSALKDVTIEINGQSQALLANTELTHDLSSTYSIRIGDLAKLNIHPISNHTHIQDKLNETLKRTKTDIHAAEQQLEHHVATNGTEQMLVETSKNAQSKIKEATKASQEMQPLRQRIVSLQTQAKDIHQKLEYLRTSRTRLREQLHELRGRLAGVDMLGFHERLDAASSTLAQAASTVERLQARAEAVQLLYNTFESCRREVEEQIIEPVQKEIQPLLHTIFPESVISLEPDMKVKGVHRPKQGNDAFESLSTGTKEQIGIAIRLGTAKTLAYGESLPVILDDALVATDEERLATMATLLKQVESHLQVLLLTCHWSRYKPHLLPTTHTIDLLKTRLKD